MTERHVLSLVLVVLSSVSCRPPDQRTDSIDPDAGVVARSQMTPEVVAQLDSGSQAFLSEDYEAALLHYATVTELAPRVGAGWFGVYMAQVELGDVAAAQEALEKARGLVPGATLLHPDAAR